MSLLNGVVIFARIFDKKLPVFRPYFYKNEPGWRIGHTGLGLLQVESTCWFGFANGIWMDGKESAELPSMQHSIYLGLLNWAPGKQKIYLSNLFPQLALEKVGWNANTGNFLQIVYISDLARLWKFKGLDIGIPSQNESLANANYVSRQLGPRVHILNACLGASISQRGQAHN